MHMVNSFDPARSGGDLGDAERELVRRRDAAMGAAYRLFYDRPLHLVRGEGAYLFDADGNDYLDAYNNVPVVGHSNPAVRRAVSEQLGTLNTHTRYLTDQVIAYAERLTGLFPSPLDQAMFACSGSEAVDLALRVARAVTGRRGIIVTRHAYHGTTTATAGISPSLGPHNPIPAQVALVDAPDSVRDDPDTAAEDFGQRIDAAARELSARGTEPGAVILDSVFSSDGLQLDPVGLLKVAAERARVHGALYIADEVQAGFGRMGDWWGFQRHPVLPDLVVLGKPMGNGIPIAGLVARPDLLDAFGRKVRYFNTFGGNPVSIAAAAAVLDEIEGQQLLQQADAVGRDLLDAIGAVVSDDPGVAATRGAGLFLAVEFVTDGAGANSAGASAPDPARAAKVVNAMRERRILISASGTYDNVLKIRPPLIFPASAIPRLAEGLAASLADTRS